MAVTSNKMVPILVTVAALIVGYVIYVKLKTNDAPISSGAPLAAVPQPFVEAASAPKAGGILGAKALPTTRSGDADTNTETLQTVIASNRDLRASVEEVVAENKRLKLVINTAAINEDSIAQRVRAQLQAEGLGAGPAPARPATAAAAPGNAPSGNAVGNILDTGLNAASQMFPGFGVQPGTAQGPAAGTQAPAGGGQFPGQSMQGTIPAGLGYDGVPVGGSAQPGSAPGASAANNLTRVIAPLGYKRSGATNATGNSGVNGEITLVRTTLASRPADAPVASANVPFGGDLIKPQPVPYFTIPENATLGRSIAMTTLVGRVPIDGRVQDPMQFKLIVGRDNLAASGQYVPDDIAGVVISGIAVGDMALSCTEGLIQSLTFVFDDGTIRTVSQRTNGASVGFGSSGGGAGGGSQALATANKLGWISDEFGNPCIPGKFVTNAPAYLADVVGAKALTAVGAAIAAAQTTTTTGASALGSTTTNTVTGNQSKYVLGKVASASSDEVVSWLSRRLNNSFDAIVVRAGTPVAVHIDQSIALDKDPEGRRLDYARGRTSLAQQQGARYGLD
jgi:integrating conjugative element protein (TIGR03752 family)